MLKGLIIATGVITAVLTGLAMDAHAEWTICNKTPEEKSVAIAYVNPRGGILSQGWWKLRACGGCAVVLATNGTSDPQHVFFRAEGKDATVQGSQQFCSSGGAFKYKETPNCADKRGFAETSINPNQQTSNITGGSPGKVCFD